MKPQTFRFLEKARKLLREAEAVLGMNLHDLAGRTSYLVCFHVAQALIFERTDAVSKTHRGVQSELFRLTKDDPSVDNDLRRFISIAYNMKAIADYEVDTDADISPERAAMAVSTAARFLEHFAGMMSNRG